MSEKLYQAIGEISEKHILEAEQWQPESRETQKSSGGSFEKTSGTVAVRQKRKIWGVIAACLAVMIGIGAWGRFSSGDFMLGEDNTTMIGGVERDYKQVVTDAEIGIIWPEEYLTIYEKYNGMTFAGREYRTRASAIDVELLGETLGNCTAQGYDIYTDTTYTEEFEVRRIRGVAPELLVAVGMEDRFYVYMQDVYAPTQTLGELMDMAGLPQTLNLQRYSVNEGHTTKGYYTIEEDNYIWQVLSECASAAIVGEKERDDWSWGMGERNYLSFTITSESLGIYKKVLYITEDGYLDTNMFEYGYLYEIGEEAAAKIISHAKENAVETAFEPYEYRLAGILTAIEDDHVRIDDSILCRDPGEGMVFRVPLDDIRIRRCIEFGGLKEGDIVMVSFRGDIDVDAGNVIRGAVSLDRGYLQDGHVAVPE